MSLNDIIQAAQGGQGVNNLASQFGLTPEQTQAAIQAMIPAFSTGLQRTAQDPTGLGGILSQLTSGVHQGSFTDPSQAGAAGGAGGGVLGQIFGSPQISAQISQQASQISGVNPQIIQQMMPIVASMLMGGLFHSMNAQGMGGILGELLGAANNPATPGPAIDPAGGAQMSGGGLLGGLVGSVLGGLFGGSGAAGANPQSAAMQAGLNTLSSMFQAGVQVSQTHQQGLSDIFNSLTGFRARRISSRSRPSLVARLPRQRLLPAGGSGRSCQLRLRLSIRRADPIARYSEGRKGSAGRRRSPPRRRASHSSAAARRGEISHEIGDEHPSRHFAHPRRRCDVSFEIAADRDEGGSRQCERSSRYAQSHATPWTSSPAQCANIPRTKHRDLLLLRRQLFVKNALQPSPQE